MTIESLEKRLTALEQQVAQLFVNRNGAAPHKDWRNAVGMFSEDSVMKKVFDNALKIREADRRKARRKAKRGQRV